MEVARSPKFLGEPRCEHAQPSDPGPVTHNRFSVSHYCLPHRLRRRLLGQCADFGAQSRSLFTRCVRFAREGHPSERKTRFQPGTTLCWTGFGPVGFSIGRFPIMLCFTTSSSSSFPRLTLAHKLRGRSRAPEPLRRGACRDRRAAQKERIAAAVTPSRLRCARWSGWRARSRAAAASAKS